MSAAQRAAHDAHTCSSLGRCGAMAAPPHPAASTPAAKAAFWRLMGSEQRSSRSSSGSRSPRWGVRWACRGGGGGGGMLGARVLGARERDCVCVCVCVCVYICFQHVAYGCDGLGWVAMPHSTP